MKVYEGKIVTLEVTDDGMEIVRHPSAVAIVAFDAQDRIVLVRQQRPAVGKALLELPAGKLDKGEAPLAAAKRELREETGLHGGTWHELCAFFTTPGFTDERMTVFMATGLEEGEPEPDDDEELELVRVPRRDVGSVLPEVEDAKTLVGLQACIVPPP